MKNEAHLIKTVPSEKLQKNEKKDLSALVNNGWTAGLFAFLVSQFIQVMYALVSKQRE